MTKELEKKVEAIIMDSIDWKEGEFKDDPGKQIIQLVSQAKTKELKDELIERLKKLKPGTEYGEYYWEDIEQIINEVLK